MAMVADVVFFCLYLSEVLFWGILALSVMIVEVQPTFNGYLAVFRVERTLVIELQIRYGFY